MSSNIKDNSNSTNGGNHSNLSIAISNSTDETTNVANANNNASPTNAPPNQQESLNGGVIMGEGTIQRAGTNAGNYFRGALEEEEVGSTVHGGINVASSSANRYAVSRLQFEPNEPQNRVIGGARAEDQLSVTGNIAGGSSITAATANAAALEQAASRERSRSLARNASMASLMRRGNNKQAAAAAAELEGEDASFDNLAAVVAANNAPTSSSRIQGPGKVLPRRDGNGGAEIAGEESAAADENQGDAVPGGNASLGAGLGVPQEDQPPQVHPQEFNAMQAAMLAAVEEGNDVGVQSPGLAIMAACNFPQGSDIINLHSYQTGRLKLSNVNFHVPKGQDPSSGVDIAEGSEQLFTLAKARQIEYTLAPLYSEHPNGNLRMSVANLFGFTKPNGESLGVMVSRRPNGAMDIVGPQGRLYRNYPEACAGITGAPSIIHIADAKLVQQMIAARSIGLPPGAVRSPGMSNNGWVVLPPVVDTSNQKGYTIYENTENTILSSEEVSLVLDDDELWSILKGLRTALKKVSKLAMTKIDPRLFRVIKDWSNNQANNVKSMASGQYPNAMDWLASAKSLRKISNYKKLTLSHFFWRWSTTSSLIATEFGLSNEQASELGSAVTRTIVSRPQEFMGIPEYDQWNTVVFPDPVEMPTEEGFEAPVVQAVGPVQAEVPVHAPVQAVGPPPLLPGQLVVEQPLPPAQQYAAHAELQLQDEPQVEAQVEAQASNPEDQAIEVVHI